MSAMGAEIIINGAVKIDHMLASAANGKIEDVAGDHALKRSFLFHLGERDGSSTRLDLRRKQFLFVKFKKLLRSGRKVGACI